MCGIAGSFGQPLLAREGVGEDELSRALAHRGRDGFGRWEDEHVSLLHWRLAVIDLSPAGAQPMSSQDGRLVLSYNGEVYNFEELRAAIEEEWGRRSGAASRDAAARGATAVARWRGRSDTEVVVEGLALWGPEFLRRLNGIFALAAYDRETGRLHLVRDRAGVKPLYVWRGGGLLLFASEAKFFFLARGFTPGIDPNGIAAFFSYGQCHGEHHVLADVRQLEPGELLTVAPGAAGEDLLVHHDRLAPAPRWQPVARPDRDAAAELRRILGRVVERQLVADVPVGVLLSGGVDSSILTALAACDRDPGKTKAFTLGYPGMGADCDEIEHARRVAAHLGVEHHVYQASQDDLVAEVERLVWQYDEPFADAAALNVFLLARMIRSQVTVALAGEGSDELFGGYRRYHLEQTLRMLGPLGIALCGAIRMAGVDRIGWIPRRAQMVLRALARRGAAARYSSYLESEIPIDTILAPEWHRVLGVHPAIQAGYPDALDGGPVAHLCLVDQQFWLPSTYLEKSDKGGMAHALEIRVPFLDNEVVAFANTLPDAQRIRGRRRKWLLREAFGDLLPSQVFTRFKRGFGVPVARWLRRELRDYYQDRVLSPGARIARFVRLPVVEACFREHLHGARDYSGLLWKCLVFETWLRHLEGGFRAGAPTADAPESPAA